MANVDTNEEFWGITLSTDNKTYAWNPAADEEDIEHKIQVTQACLGVKAKEGERNVIEVTTEDDDGEKISCAIVSLRVGYAECMHLELGFTNAVKFALKEGSGPLSLSGVHLSAMPLDLDPEDESEEEESSDDEEDVPQLVEVVGSTATVEELPAETAAVEAPAVVETKKDDVKVEVVGEEKNPKKRELVEDEVAVAAKKQKPEKEEAAKVVVATTATTAVKDEDEDDDEDDEDDDDDDDDMDGLDMDDLDSDDDDIDMDDMDSDDLESDEDDDEDDDDETEEEETPKPKKKPAPKVNGVAKAAPAKQTPKPKEKAKPNKPSANKENVDNSNKNAATPKTKTKDTPKKDTTTPKKTPEELRTFLLKSPNLPKKYEKFSNFLKNNMKVTDAKTQKELWEYVQKNKK